MMNNNPQKKITRTSLGRNTSFLSIILVIGVFIFAALFIQSQPEEMTDGDGALFQVSFIDIAQGDSILIRNPQNEFMLIDTGESDQYNRLKAYLDEQGVENFKYVIFTHPHSDHIGAADKIVREYDIETLIMPQVTHTTNTFSRLLNEIEAKNMGITPAEVGDEYSFGSAKFLIIAPMREDYKDLNDHSVVIKMIYGANTFLFTGDMEKASEEDIINFCETTGADISANVLKVAHHGSSTSSGQQFLELVNPMIAVISCDGVSYGHPHDEVIERLSSEKIKAEILRTDLHGTVVISSDGKSLTVNEG